jgi:hypothetical protein
MSRTAGKKGMKGKRGATQVPGQLYGYSVQESRLLAHLLIAEDGDVVSLEVIDDVGVVGATRTTAEQTKSGLAHNPISDLAKDLWKTLSNWLTAIRQGTLPSDAKFLLYVAQPHNGHVVQQINDVKTHAEALALLKQLRDRFWGKPPAYRKRAKLGDEVAPYINAILSAQDNVVVDLFRNFVLETAVKNPNDDLDKLLRSKALDDKAINDVSRYLLGWVKKKVHKLIESGVPASIAYSDFHQVLVAAAKKFNTTNALSSVAQPPGREQIEGHLRSRTYVRQIQLVELTEDEQVAAVNDFIRAAIDRTRWSEQGDVLEPSFEEFADQLRRAWSNKRRLAEIEFAHHPEVPRGRALFSRCMDFNAKLQSMEVPTHFIAGSFHALADEVVVGWHPRYEALLSGVNDDEEETDEEVGDGTSE